MSEREIDLMTLKEVADYLRTPEATVRYWRHKRTGPPGFKVGRHIVYHRHEVEAWVQAQPSVGGPKKEESNE